MTGTYQLTHDEQKAAKARLLSNARLQRLLQVRVQDKQLAKARSRSFKQLCDESAHQLRVELVQLIQQQREQELAHLRTQYQAALQGLASAQRNAAVSAQQLAIEREEKHKLFLKWEKAAQQRFTAALARVQAARQAELQVVLHKLQLRQGIMHQHRELAKQFAGQQKQQQAHAAQCQAELDLLEEQRRRHNQVSRIDFKYSRLHELGVPQLVANHKGLLSEHAPDAATQAQTEAARTREEQLALQQKQQEHAKKAVERGVNAQLLIQAERNRQRMEQALKELESNEIEQRKQDLATGKLTAAPLLRKWQQQKRKAQARRFFEQEFLPDPARPHNGFPTFLAYADEPAAPAAEAEESTPAGQAAAAERALKLIAELEKQRQMEAKAAQRQQQYQLERRAAAAAAAQARPSSSAASSELEIPVHVEDLMDFIPPASKQLVDPRFTPASDAEAAVPAEATSTLPSQPSTAAAAEDTAPAGVSEEEPSEPQQLTAEVGAAGASSVSSSQDSIAVIMQAADEVLRQLPAEMQAAAARRAAAAAGQKLPQSIAAERTTGASSATARVGVSGQRDSTPASTALQTYAAHAGELAAELQTAATEESAASPEEKEDSSGRRSSIATDSSADAAAILQELHLLQEQLGMELLGSSTADSDLEQLAAFGQEAQHMLQHQTQQPARASHATAAGATCQKIEPAATAAKLVSGHQQVPEQGSAAQQALNHEDSVESQLLAGPAKTELEDLIGRILAPDYPSNLFGPVSGPQPSVHSPTRPAGRSSRRAAAQSATHQQQQQQPAESYDLATGFMEVQQELKAMGLPSVDLSNISSSVSGDDVLLQGVLRREVSSSDSDVTLPTTVLGAMDREAPGKSAMVPAPAAAGAKTSTGLSAASLSITSTAAPAAAMAESHRASLQQLRKLQPGVQTSTPVPAPPLSAAAAAAAPRGSSAAQNDVAAAAMAAAKQAILDLSSSLDSFSTTTDTSDELDRLLGTISETAQHVAKMQNSPVGGSVLSSSAVSLPSTLQLRLMTVPAAPTRPQLAPTAAGTIRPAAVPAAADASTAVSLPSTLPNPAVAGSTAAAAASAGAEVDYHLAALRELLSLQDSDDSFGSPAAAALAGREGAAAAAEPSSTSSSSISSMLDDELDQLLQKALAGRGNKVQQQHAGAIERALEAMVDAEDSAAAAAATTSAAPASMLSLSTTIPSTVRAQMPGSIGADLRGGFRSSGHTIAAAGEAAAAPVGPPGTSDSSSSSSAGSGSTTSSSRTEAALRMAKQSARQWAAASAATAAAAAASAAGSSSDATSLPSTVERHLRVAATAAKVTEVGVADMPSVGPDMSLPAVAALGGGNAAHQARPTAVAAAGIGYNAGSSSSMSVSLPSTLEKMLAQQLPQQVVSGWGASSSSSTLSLLQFLWQQGPLEQKIQQLSVAAGPGSADGGSSSSTSLPSTIRRLADGSGGSSAVATGSSSGSSSGPGLAGATAQGSLPRVTAVTASTSAYTAGNQQRQQLQQQVGALPQATTAAAAGRARGAVLEPIAEEDIIASTSLTRGSPPTTSNVISELQYTSQQQQGSAATPTDLTPSSASSSSGGKSNLGEGSSSSLPGSGNDGDDSVSSDSFSGVVSELMHHIDSTLASLACASSSGVAEQQSAAAMPANPARNDRARKTQAPRRSGDMPVAHQGQQHQQRDPAHLPYGTRSSSINSNEAAGDAARPETPSGSSSSSNSSGATDSSTARFIAQALADMDNNPMSPESSASTAGLDTGSSRLLYRSAWQEPLVAGREAPATEPTALEQPRRAAPTAVTHTSFSGTAAMEGPAYISGASQAVDASGSAPTPVAAGRMTAAAAAQSPAETVSTSSRDTDQLLGSLGSLLAGSTPSSSNEDRVSSGSSNFSFHAAAALVAGHEQQGTVEASSSAASMAYVAAASSNVTAANQPQQQQPALSSGLSQLLADILSEDPKLASQLGS